VIIAGFKLKAHLCLYYNYLVFIIFLLIYKYAPNIKTTWKTVLPGAALASIIFEAMRSLFMVYLGYIANYDLIYGSLGSIIVLLILIYFSAYILIIGGEFSSEYQKMRAEQIKKV
jgi:membrane protein